MRLVEGAHRVRANRRRALRRRAAGHLRQPGRPHDLRADAPHRCGGARDAGAGGRRSAGASIERSAAPRAASSSTPRPNARLSYGSLAATAATLPVPSDDHAEGPVAVPAGRQADEATRHAGQGHRPRRSTASTSSARACVYAVVARCPVFGGTVVRVRRRQGAGGARRDRTSSRSRRASRSSPPTRGRRCRAAARCRWSSTTGANASSEHAGHQRAVRAPDAEAGSRGRGRRAMRAAVAGSGARTIERAVRGAVPGARADGAVCLRRRTCAATSATSGSARRFPAGAQQRRAGAAGCRPAASRCTPPTWAAASAAAAAARSSPRRSRSPSASASPINLTYSREDEIQHDLYRPASTVRFAAALDADGWPVAHDRAHRLPDLDGAAQRRRARKRRGDRRLRHPEPAVEYHDPGIGIPTGYWRSVGLSQNAFFAESFIDETGGRRRQGSAWSCAAGSTPRSPRLLGVLNLAAEKAGWGTPLPAGRFRGIAAVAGFGSFNAQVAEISMDAGQGPRPPRRLRRRLRPRRQSRRA